MARWLRTPRAAKSRDEVVAHLRATLPDLRIDDDEQAPPTVRWRDGPGLSTVAERIGPLDGWTLATGVDPERPGNRVVVLRRELSAPAVAVALVRFYGSKGRHYTSADERGGDAFAALTDVDDPATSGYPIVDAVASMLLEHAGPDAAADVDALSAALRDAGYDRLWAEAYGRVD